MRVADHPILGKAPDQQGIKLIVDGRTVSALEGETIAASLLSAAIRVFRRTPRTHEPRGVFCGIGRCTDCVMTVNGVPNVRTCVTLAEDGMIIETQEGLGKWGDAR